MSPHFNLEYEYAYQQWRAGKLDQYPTSMEALTVTIEHFDRLDDAEIREVMKRVKKTNMVMVQCTNSDCIDQSALLEFGKQFSLVRTDKNLCADNSAVSAIQVSPHRRENEYIPYTNRPLSWHTDGYYNHPLNQIRAWTLFCRQDASEGGENALLDPEILYILLRDENPAFIRALSANDVMGIPANIQEGVTLRPARSGPVFSVELDNGGLHMRYSARAKNITWKQDGATQDALDFINTLFSSGSAYIFRHRMKPGQCLMSNNVLHKRTGFIDRDDSKRVVYRVRYLDRIGESGARNSSRSSD
jgi:alpha-ketoglutarate-dependent taurine dioxygenase